MTEEKLKLLAELLEEMAHQYRGWTPTEVWRASQVAFCRPALEIIITRNKGKEFLLSYRKDKDYDAWHIPGGFILVRETIEDACNRIVCKELGIKGLNGLKLIDAFKWSWPGHPFGGSPISLVYAISSLKEVEETCTVKYFREIPRNTIPEHAGFLKTYINTLKVKKNHN